MDIYREREGEGDRDKERQRNRDRELYDALKLVLLQKGSDKKVLWKF